jgi:2-hydroxycyclohexanecarboxyl-CoA dehydrogenase
MSSSVPNPVEQTVVITGAGSERGIGRATALRLASDGYAIAILDLDEEAARHTAEVVATAHGVKTFSAKVDVADVASVAAAVAALEASDLPAVSGLVNNAGITSPTRFLDIELDEWERIFRVNVTGTFIVTKAFLPGMIERGFGRIVNLSSVSAQRGGGVFGGTHYSAAKAAVLGLTRALAREIGHHGVVINSVAPGFIGTDITAGKLTDERRAAIVAEIPVARGGETADVANLIAYLTGREVGYVTGATFDVNGGSHIH